MTPRLSGHFSIIGLVFLVLKSLLGIATQWSHVKFAFMTLKLRSHVFLNTSNLGYFPLTQHHTLVSLVTKPSSLITWTYHEVETAVVYHMQKVSRKSSWQANGTWLFRSFQLKKLLWATEFLKRKGNVFLFQMFQAEIRVPFHRSHLWYQFQAFVAVFWENGFDLCKWWTRLKDEICQSWILLTICPNRESISVCPCILVNNPLDLSSLRQRKVPWSTENNTFTQWLNLYLALFFSLSIITLLKNIWQLK